MDERERRVRFGGTCVDLERFQRCFLRFRKTVAWLEAAVDDEHVVTVGETGVRRAVVRIDLDRLVEIIDRLEQSVAGAFVPRVPTLQIEPVRFELFLFVDVQFQTFSKMSREMSS